MATETISVSLMLRVLAWPQLTTDKYKSYDKYFQKLHRTSFMYLSPSILVGCAATAQVKHGAGSEGVLLRHQPRYHCADLIQFEESPPRDARQHVVDELLAELIE